MNHPITLERTGIVRDADGAKLGRVTFEAEARPEKRKRQIAALRAMLETDKDDFSRAMHRAALEQLLEEERLA